MPDLEIYDRINQAVTEANQVPVINDSINKTKQSPTLQELIDKNNENPALGDLPKNLNVGNMSFPKITSKEDFNAYQRHFVRFFINIDEESKLEKINKRDGLGLSSDTDQSDQSRLRNGTVSEDRFKYGSAALGAMAVAGSSKAIGMISKIAGKGTSTLGKMGAGVAATTAVLGSGAAAGYLVSEAFNVTKKLKRMAGSITLYAPGDISTSYGISYNQTDNMLNELLKTDKGSEIIGGDDAVDKATGAASKMTRIVASIGSPDVLGSMTRTARNKKRDLLFDSVDNRNFSFSYNFMPRNASEALEVADIIHAFIYHSHPDVLAGFDQFLVVYPAEFDIEYVYVRDGEETENPFIRKISSCVITGIDIQYGNGGSYQSLAAGEPIATRLNLRFKEIENLTKDRISAGL